MKSLIKALVVIGAILVTTNAINGQSITFLEENKEAICYFVGEISLPATTAASFAICLNSGTSEACSMSMAALNCASDPACSKVVSRLTRIGCNYTVEKTGESLRFIGEATYEGVENLKATFDSLDSIEGVRWIQKKLTF